jgi:CRP-like cAMP-binding protein
VLGSQEAGKVDALKRVPLFAGLSRHDLGALGRISEQVDFAVGEELIHENEPGKHFFVVLEGAAEVRRDGAEVNRLGPGDFFGEISLLSDRPTTASVVTTAPSRVVLITPPDFRKLLEDVPLIQMKVIEALAARLPDEFYWQA